MAKDTDYFIKVVNPKQTRKSLLENTRDVLKVLQGYEDFKRVREKRTSLINYFNNDMANVKSMVSELKKAFPKVVIKETKRTVMEVQKPIKEIKRVEQELAEIEEKLSKL